MYGMVNIDVDASLMCIFEQGWRDGGMMTSMGGS